MTTSATESAEDLLKRLTAVKKQKNAIEHELRKKRDKRLQEVGAKYKILGPASQTSSHASRTTDTPTLALQSQAPCRIQSLEEWKAYKKDVLAELVKEKEELFEKQALLYSAGSNDEHLKLTMPDSQEIDRIVQQAKEQLPAMKANLRKLEELDDARRLWIQKHYGPGSYEPWQLKDRKMAAEIVNEVLLPRVLKACLSRQDVREQRIKCHQEQLIAIEWQERNWKKAQIMQSMMSDIVEDVLYKKVCEVTQETLAIGKWSHQLGSGLCISVALDLAVSEEEASSIWRKAVLKRVPNDEKYLSLHNQQISTVGGSEELYFSDDPTPISWKTLLPIVASKHSKYIRRFAAVDERFEVAEGEYWKSLKVKDAIALSVLNSEPAQVLTSSVCRTGERLAVSFADGSVVVWDTRSLQATHKHHDPSPSVDGRDTAIMCMTWAQGCQQLAGIAGDGSLKMWSMGSNIAAAARSSFHGSELGEEDTPKRANRGLRNMLRRLKQDSTQDNARVENQRPMELFLVLEQTGDEITRHVGTNGTGCIIVWPAAEVFDAATETLAIGLTCGTILQLSINILSSSVVKRTIFKYHSSPLIFVDFVKNQPTMVSMDTKGFICKWHRSSACQSVRGWFTPLTVHRLDLFETVLVHLPEHDKPYFTDKKRAKRSSRQLAAERVKAEEYLAGLNLPTAAWYSESDSQTITNIINPLSSQPERPVVFYSITRLRKNAVLALLVQQVYQPTKGREAILLTAVVDPSRHLLVVVLLCQNAPPKEPHLTLLQLSLTDLSVLAPRIDVGIPSAQVDSLRSAKNITVSISDELLTPGCRHAVLNIDGSVVVVSLATGLIVLSANGVSTAAGIDVEEYYGCQLSEAQAKLSSDCSGFRLVATDSYIGLLVTDKSQVLMTPLFSSQSSNLEKRVYRAYFKEHSYFVTQRAIQRQHPADHCIVFTMDGLLPSSLDLAKNLRKILLDIADQAMAASNRNTREEANQDSETPETLSLQGLPDV